MRPQGVRFSHHRDGSLAVSSADWLTLFAAEGFSGVVFDCDGTLVHSSEAHFRALQAAVREQCRELSKDWYCTRTGLDRQSVFEAYQDQTTADFDADRVALRSIAHFASFVHLIRPIATVVRFAAALRQQGVPLAVATNSEGPVAALSLQAAGVHGFFAHIISISDGVPPKPCPAMFARAAECLGVPRCETLVVEDSPQGVQAARAAGMSVIQLV